MSGGHFNYEQHLAEGMGEEVEELIKSIKKNEFDGISEKVIEHFELAAKLCYLSSIYIQRIDWLVSGDDSEESFFNRLKEDLHGASLDKYKLIKDEAND